MRFSRPSNGTVLGAVALFVALGGTALAATGTIVNIADPSNAANVAHVDASGKLLVGDGSGLLTVDGLVTTQQAAPNSYWRASGSSTGPCAVIGTPPSGKAVILKTVDVNLYAAPSGTLSGNNFIVLYNNTTCTGKPIWDETPRDLGEHTVNLEPGVGIPSTQGLSAIDYDGAGYSFEVYATGYTVSASQVPSTAAQSTGPARHSSGPPAAQG